MKEMGLLGDYHLLLAHDVLAKPKEYAEVYGDIPNAEIIMDNSLIELGYALPMDEIVEAAHVVGAKYVVLPDYLEESRRTLIAVRQAREQLYKTGAPMIPIPVVQGRTLEECRNFIRELAHEFVVETFPVISIPRVVTNKLGGRLSLIILAQRYYFDVHLLGFSNNLLDDICCSRMSNVRGIDSASPIRMAFQMECHIDINEPVIIPPRGDFWDKDETWARLLIEEGHSSCYFKEVLTYNIQQVRKWIQPNTSTLLT
jgi:hypothetical protein